MILPRKPSDALIQRSLPFSYREAPGSRYGASPGYPVNLHRALRSPWHELFGMTETGVNACVRPEEHELVWGPAPSAARCRAARPASSGRTIGPSGAGKPGNSPSGAPG